MAFQTTWRAVSLTLSIFAIGLAAAPVEAQIQGSAGERGFAPDKAYQIGEVDHVNLFNGNLLATIPIGRRYALDAGLSYGLTLTYNAVAWEYEEVCPTGDLRCYNKAYPMREDNAGFGWMLTLGELRFAGSAYNPSLHDVYLGPDGADHAFYASLHEGEAIQNGVWYSRDGSYLRMKTDGTGRLIEFPDGTIHRFNAAGELTRIESRKMNGAVPAAFVDVFHTRVGNVLVRWDITDSSNRLHKVHFTARTVDGQSIPLVSSVELASVGGTAIYTFQHTAFVASRPEGHNYSGTGPTATVQALTRVNLPAGGGKYKMGLRPTGHLSTLELPTGGLHTYTYRNYRFPHRPQYKEGSNPDPYDQSWGIGTRVLSGPGATAGTWTYESGLGIGNKTTTVTDPTNHRRRHHFRAEPESVEDALPYTLDLVDGVAPNQVYLSVEVLPPGTSNTPLRQSFVRYEWDRPRALSAAQISLGKESLVDINRRVAAEKTIFEDGTVKEVTYSGFDGLGHYRTMTTGGNYTAADVRSATTNYNPGRGVYRHEGVGTGQSYVAVPKATPWVLETWDEQSESEGGVTAKRQACFDTTTGLLLRERTLKNSAPGATDVVRVYTLDGKGNRTLEQYFGGDLQAVGTGALCSLALPAGDQLRVAHTYQYGTLKTSQPLTATGASLGFMTLDLTLDPTGLPTVSRDTAGFATSYTYDLLGRPTWIKPGSGGSAWTQITYAAATATTRATATVTERPNGSTTTELGQTTYSYDAFGRLARTERDMPGSAVATSETFYDALGRVKEETETEGGASPIHRTSYTYDAFDRPVLIRPSDGAAHDVTLSYFGEKVVNRRVKMGTSRNATTGAVVETEVKTREIYDRQGRLWRLWEDDGGSLAAMTEYLYDVGNRLKKVTMTRGSVTQVRDFYYDNRGFLLSEKHPEKGTSGNGTVFYGSYNVSGQPGTKTDGPQSVEYAYDRASRLTQVREATGARRVLETRSYGSGMSAADRSAGKLQVATRNNYHDRFGVNFPISQTYTYGGRDGQVSRLVTTVNTIDSYTQSLVWDPQGGLASVTYPSCNHCPAAQKPPARVVSYTYNKGLLSSVPGWASSITYHPNGMVHQVTHANGVVWTQGKDPANIRRPASIKTALGAATLFDTGTYKYDGAGNVVQSGTDYYLYDGLGRLKEGTVFKVGSSRYQKYAYDGFGNQTSVTTYVGGAGTTRGLAINGGTNRLSLGSYDAAGSQLTWGSQAYTWDPMGAMQSFRETTVNDWAYAYDPDGERVLVYDAKTGNSVFRLRGLDGKVLREIKLTGGVWSWGQDWIYRDGTLLATIDSLGNTRHAHPDHLGSPRLFTDLAGVVKATYHYFPFGEQASAPAVTEAMRYTGHERDVNGNGGTIDDLDYMHARYYSPHMGRFLSFDPGKDSDPKVGQSWNFYAYGRNNPMRHVDPDGEAIETLWDIANVGMDVVSLAKNVASGNYGGAALDVAALVADVGATVVPGVPGGAGTALKAVRAADQAVDASKAVNRGTHGGKRAGMSFTRKDKQVTHERAKGLCQGCGTKTVPGQRHTKGVTPPKNERQADHVWPRAKGGNGDTTNSQSLCRSCNLRKSDKILEER